MSMRRMWRLGLLTTTWLSILLMGACQDVPSNPPTKSFRTTKQAIIGGKPDLRYPAVGGLLENNNTFCTATLIATKVLLTAAHCIDSKGPASKISFRIDIPSQGSASGFQSHYYDVDTSRLKPHPKWNGSLSGGHDIAIALLRTAVPANIAKPMRFNTTPLDQTWIGKEPLFMGFGLIESDPKAISPDTKHAVKVPIIIMRNDEFLTQGNGKNTCHGDSGGPALETAGGVFSIIGVNSYSQSARVPGSNPPRTKCDGRAGIARVDVYARFIQSMLDQYGDAPPACQTSADCTQCNECSAAGAQKQCQRKPSLRAPNQCKPCVGDPDCGNGNRCHRFDEGFRCLQRCPTNGCCPGNTRCLLFQSGNKEDWYCVPDQNKCPELACQTEKDCGPGELCTNNKCAPKRPPRSAKLCHPCTTHDDCPGDDAYCMGPKGGGYCAQACGDADFCPQGTACQQPYRGTPKQCLAKNGCPIPCNEDKDCPTDFTCQGQGTKSCVRKTGGAQGDFCSEDNKCQQGFECIQTLDGKRCLKPCGVPLGKPGSLCLPGLKCDDKASCYSAAGIKSSCIQQCDADSVCNGGTCFNRVCKCTKDEDCYEGFFCNKSSGFFPSCISKKLNRQCDAGFTCQSFGDVRFCAATQGSVAYGQPCDAFHRCRPSLACIEGKDGYRCLEDCTKTRGCTLGGLCSSPKDGVSVCVCKRDRQCSSGSICTPPFYLGEFGYCNSPGQTTQCRSRLECAAGYTCEKGKCVVAPPAPEVPEEPMPEPMPEPVVKDEPPAPRPEPKTPDEPPTPEPEPQAKEPTKPDAGSKDTGAADKGVADAPGGGCSGCSTSQEPMPPWFALLCLIFIAGRLTYRYPKKETQ